MLFKPYVFPLFLRKIPPSLSLTSSDFSWLFPWDAWLSLWGGWVHLWSGYYWTLAHEAVGWLKQGKLKRQEAKEEDDNAEGLEKREEGLKSWLALRHGLAVLLLLRALNVNLGQTVDSTQTVPLNLSFFRMIPCQWLEVKSEVREKTKPYGIYSIYSEVHTMWRLHFPFVSSVRPFHHCS